MSVTRKSPRRRITASACVCNAAQASLHLFEGQYLLTARHKGGVANKFISPGQARDAFAAEPVDTGFLPLNTLRWGVNAQGEFILLHIPAQRHDLLVMRPGQAEGAAEKINVPLPPLVLAGRGRSWRVWALRDAAPRPSSQVFYPPLPNIMPAGEVCWGANKPPVAGAKTVLAAWDLFLAAPFNGHAVVGRAAGNKYNADARKLLFDLAKRKPMPRLGQGAQLIEFPVNELVPLTRYGYSFEALVNDFLGQRETEDGDE